MTEIVAKNRPNVHILKTNYHRNLANGSFEAECAIFYLTLIHLCDGLTAQLFEFFPKKCFFHKYSLLNLIYVCFDNKLQFWMFVTEYNNT